MSLYLYTLINFFVILTIFAGLIMPALIIYFYSRFNNHIALIVASLVLILPILVLGANIIVLLPFILPIIIAGLMGTLLRKFGEEFWLSMGYMIVAELAGMVIGVVIIYFYFGMQDITGLLANSFRDAYMNLPSSDKVGIYGIDLMVKMLMDAQNGVSDNGFMSRILTDILMGAIPVIEEVSDMTMGEKLDVIVPVLKNGMASVLPSAIMSYGIVSGVWAWFISSVLIKSRVDNKKSIKGIKKYIPHPPFSEWKLPRWFTNVLIVLLLAAILISLGAKGKMAYVASTLQTVALVILSIQGLAVINWWLKSKKINTAVNVLICCLAVVFLNFFLPLLGMFDVVFPIRISKEQREAIMEKMNEIKKQVDQQRNEIKEAKKKEEENKDSEDIEDKSQEDKDESEEEK